METLVMSHQHVLGQNASFYQSIIRPFMFYITFENSVDTQEHTILELEEWGMIQTSTCDVTFQSEKNGVFRDLKFGSRQLSAKKWKLLNRIRQY